MKSVSAKQLDKNFWRKILKTETCWVWLGKPNNVGYGRCSLEGQRMFAHRASYELHKGEISEGLEVDHMCHNRMCVNPEHLQLVTHKENKENSRGAYACNISGVRGVTWSKSRNKWVAQVAHHGRTIHIGRFTSISDAEAAVKEARNLRFTNNLLDRVA